MSHRKMFSGGESTLARLYAQNLETPKRCEIRSEGSEATVYVYDVIDDYFGVGGQQFAEQVAQIEAETIHLRVDSPGGSVFTARSMQTVLRQHSARVVAHIDGLAASAATFLIAAADEIVMTVGGRMMIHSASTFEFGNAEDFRNTAEILDGIDTEIAQTYAKRTKKPWEDMLAMMREEMWMTASEALEMGMVDSVFDPDQPVENRWDLSAYSNAPDDFPQAKSEDPDPIAESTDLPISALLGIVERMEAAADKMTAAEHNETPIVQSEPIPDPIETISDEPVARSVANRKRRLSLLETEIAPGVR